MSGLDGAECPQDRDHYDLEDRNFLLKLKQKSRVVLGWKFRDGEENEFESYSDIKTDMIYWDFALIHAITELGLFLDFFFLACYFLTGVKKDEKEKLQ